MRIKKVMLIALVMAFVAYPPTASSQVLQGLKNINDVLHGRVTPNPSPIPIPKPQPRPVPYPIGQDFLKEHRATLPSLENHAAMATLPKMTTEEKYRSLCLSGQSCLLDKHDTITAMKCFNAAIDLSKEIDLSQTLRGRMNMNLYLESKYYRGTVYMAKGEIDSAIVDMLEVERLGNKKSELVQNAILSLMACEKAKCNYALIVMRHHSLQMACPQIQKNANYHIFISDTYLRQGNIDRACDHLDEALGYSRDSTLTYLQFLYTVNSEIYSAFAVSSLIECLADRIFEKERNIGMDELNLVLSSLFTRERDEDIIVLYDKYHSYYGDYPPLLSYATYAYLSTGELENAQQTYEKLSQIIPYDSLSFGQYITCTVYREGLSEIKNLIQLEEVSILIENAEWAAAFDALKTIPDSLLDATLLSFCAFMQVYSGENLNRALEQYNRLVKLDPSSDSYYGRGYCYYNMKDFDNAKKDFITVLALEKDKNVSWNTANAFFYLGNEKMAKKTAKSLCSKNSLSFEEYYEASLFYETIGRKRKAYRLLRKGLKEEHDKRIYPLVIMSYKTPSLKGEIEELLSNQ